MIGVIPTAGFGKRMLPLTKELPKSLLPILNKPLIYYIIEKMEEIELEEIFIITGYLGKEIEKRINGSNIKFIRQNNVGDPIKAIKLLDKYINDDFMVIWGDNLFQGDLYEIFSTHFKKNPSVSVILDKKREKNETAMVFIKDGKITRVEEKPNDCSGCTTLAGVLIFPPIIFDAIAEIYKYKNPITLLQWIINKGLEVNYTWLNGWRVNVNTPSNLLNANLEMLKGENKRNVIGNSIICGKVYNSVIGDNVIIHKGGLIENSLIMDNVKVKGDIRLNYTIVRDGKIVDKNSQGIISKPIII